MNTLSFESKFKLGDKAYYTEFGPAMDKVACPVCKGTGDVTIVGYDRELTCPNCYGDGKVTKHRNIVKEVEIVEITVGITNGYPGTRPGTYLTYSWYLEEHNTTSYRNEDDLYTTREDAQVEADRLNLEHTIRDPII